MSEELRSRLEGARARRESGDMQGALAELERCMAQHPGHGAVLAEKAWTLQALGRHGEAAGCFERVLALTPDNHELRAQFAMSLAQSGRANRAKREFERLVAAKPDDAVLRVNYAAALRTQGRTEEAIAQYRLAAATDVALAEAHAGLGIALRMARRPQEALAALARAAELSPGEARTLAAAGDACRDLGLVEQSIEWYRRALAADPAMPEARINLGQALLLLGRYAEGWDVQEWFTSGQAQADCEAPPWAGEALAGCRVLVRLSKGLGDQVMFAGCVPDLIARGAHCILDCEPRLAALLMRSFPACELRSADAVADFSVTGHALIRQLRRDPSAFPPASEYLIADPDLRTEARRRLSALGPGLKIGLSWRGGTVRTRADQRRIPLAELEPLARTPGVHCISLQYGEGGGEIGPRENPAAHGIAHWPDFVDDPDRSAALIAELDLVISVPTTVIHLAGALGRPLWILTPFTPDYRYLAAGERMPWYPQALLLRQAAPGDWSLPLSRAAQQLAAMAAQS